MLYSRETSGFYSRDVHGDDVPNDVVKITSKEYTALLTGQSGGRVIEADQDGRPVLADIPDASLKALAGAAMRRINADYTAVLSITLSQYPDAETLSFDKQEREAREWSADNAAATPYLDAMLVERPIGKQELVIRILAKADAFIEAHGVATGKRQRLEDEVKAALLSGDRDLLESISWEMDMA